jgi:large subunit ribosomal protein L7/L12
MPNDDTNLDAELRDLLARGRKIEAIKRYRDDTGVGLKEAKDAVEGLERGEALPSMKAMDSAFENEIVSLLEGGKKIEAIKVYREKTGVGLKEAKDFIEALAADRRIAAPSRSGCLGVVLVVAAIVLMIVAKSLAAEDEHRLGCRTISLSGKKGGMLANVDGQLRLVDSPIAWTEWTLRETDKGWTIQPLFREESDARYLSFDGDGKVTLVAEPGEGVYWKLTRKGDRLNTFDATIQASGGKFDGWYLGFPDEQEQIEKGNRKYKSYQVNLSQTPSPRTNLCIFIRR